MSRATIRFERCVQNIQEAGSDDDHMVSRVFFSIEAEGRLYAGLTADLKQTTGADYEKAPIEVSLPDGYAGPMNYNSYRDAVERYYRSLVGSKGRGFRLGAGSRNIRMINNLIVIPGVGQFDYE